jgi:hypothetical protein
MWERESDFARQLNAVQTRASKEQIDALARLAVDDHKQVRVRWRSAQLGRGQQCCMAAGNG